MRAPRGTSFLQALRAKTHRAQSRPLKIVIVSYGKFDSNSAGHVAGFGDGLARLGHSVAVCGAGDISKVYSHGRTEFEFFGLQSFIENSDRVIAFDGSIATDRTVLLCWTPREIVRRAVAPAIERHRLPYVVHLEDNEAYLTEVFLREARAAGRKILPFPPSRADPARLDGFLAGAAGVTVIEERLREFVPEGVETLVLEPGVDLDAFGADPGRFRRATVRRAVGVNGAAAVLVYPGNIHRWNVDEVRELYEAVGLLRGRGRDVVLVRTGADYDPDLDFVRAAGVAGAAVSLGQVERPFLVDLLKIADVFVQPGRPGPFNDYRLPSKLPEFMAVGRPIILPAANVGTRLRDGVDALLLRDGSAGEIAGRVEMILDDPALRRRLAKNARRFAERHYRREAQTRKLDAFLRRVI